MVRFTTKGDEDSNPLCTFLISSPTVEVASRGKEHKRTLSAAQAIRYPEITVKKNIMYISNIFTVISGDGDGNIHYILQHHHHHQKQHP